MAAQENQTQNVPLCPGIEALPVVHGSLEYTVAVRQALLDRPPALLAVELPENLRAAVLQCLPEADNIPFITLRHEDDDHPFHFIMEPLEPIVEALRSAYELEIPFQLIDRFDGRHSAWLPESFPDTYALRLLNPFEMYELFERHVPEATTTPLEQLVAQIDAGRELHMASRLRQLMLVHGGSLEGDRKILFIGGMRHIRGLRRYLAMNEEEFTQAFNQGSSLLPEVDQLGGAVTDEEPLEALLRAANQPVPEIEVALLARKSSEVLEQPAFFNSAWNLVRGRPHALPAFNRIDLLRAAYREAVRRYERESGELVPPQREKLFFRFARNWSIVENRLLPDTYRMVIAARGFGNDNFARIVYNVLHELPPTTGSTLPEQKLTLDDLQRDSRLVRFRTKVRIKRKVPPPDIVRRFRREKYPGEWREAWRGTGICSYPPEDIQIEEFGRFLQQRARAIVQGSEVRTMPFTSSLMDGIDYRETVRNLQLGKIFVREVRQRGLEAGSVVVIFSEDSAEFPWRQVWWGEHQQESDMAFYATAPGEQMAGPGITRCRYGGFMLTYPPGRLHDIWEDSTYRDFRNPADRLLVGALVYNERNSVVHLSNRAPHPKLTQLAGRMGQKIIHIPLSTISSVMLGRIQRFHVLDSRERRDEADDFIW